MDEALGQASTSERHLKELQLLHALSGILDQSLDMRDVVSPVLDSLADFMGMNYGTLTLLNRKTGDILIEAAHGLSPQQAQRGRYKVGEGVTGRVIQTGEAIVIPNKSDSPLILDRTKRGKGQGTSFICVPIKVGKETVGALSVDQIQRPQEQLAEDARLLSIVASMIAQAVKLRRAAQEEREKLERENERLQQELRERFRPSNIVGASHEMQVVYDQIAKVSKSSATVLILGETGTGKELVANAIHYNSDRAGKPFVKAHCAALPESLIESELFGHVKGAFTGALADRKGRFELANGGTLFLDEIGDIPLSIQIKLLRVLQEREFERVGSTQTVKVNVRLIAATNRSLEEMVRQGRFREDLFYRLHVFPIFVPPLRNRKADVVLLADHFLAKYARDTGKNVRRLSSAVIDMLMSYHWPGNVRELENCIERAVLVAEGDVIHPYHLPPTLQTAEHGGSVTHGSLKEIVDAYERDILVDALKSARGKMAVAARNLKTTERIFVYKVRRHGIDPKRYAPEDTNRSKR
ncbi:MAG: sigma 54-interacting transcriptional regulator [Kiritimatiellae bacterium]|nr:sigma 54-interacting transcriptional regulator [Kiritimatiellia bacterium]MCO5069270.1 sigma 54-interacting transcriptional regulator [Kiritimatiellia bacterium]MCO6401644.1 sigma 54-interacting transcriptional regulator [Verrucomicrobiota bacterium]